MPYLRTRPARIYLNGDYRGFYTVMELPAQAYVMQVSRFILCSTFATKTATRIERRVRRANRVGGTTDDAAWQNAANTSHSAAAYNKAAWWKVRLEVEEIIIHPDFRLLGIRPGFLRQPKLFNRLVKTFVDFNLAENDIAILKVRMICICPSLISLTLLS